MLHYMQLIIFVPLLLPLLLLNPIQGAYSLSTPSCISYNPAAKSITVNCTSANLSYLNNQINDPSILYKQEEQQSPFSSPSSSNNIWILNSNLTIAQGATFYINSTDTAWLKISSKDAISYSNGNAAYGIQVFGSLKIDSVKITSWNSETNDYSTYMTNESKSTRGPFIIVQKGASGTTDITNSEIAYLKWLSYFGGNGSVLRGDNIHHLSFGFYSKDVSDMILEGNNVHDNGIYGIDPHTGTHDMIIRNNDVHNDGSIDIICSLNCYNITIEGNNVSNNRNNITTGSQFPIGIMFSRNTSNSIARNNFVENESKGISVTTGSHNNEINNNTVSNSGRGIYVNHGSSQNTVHGNTIINPSIFGLDVDTGAFGNMFYSNLINNAQHFGINIQSSDIANNTFKNNKLLNSSSTNYQNSNSIVGTEGK